MGKFDRIVNITESPRTKNAWRLATSELTERGKSMFRIVSYLVAKDAYEGLLNSIPGGSEYKELRDSLELAEVGVGKGNQGAYAIHAPIKARRVRKIDVPKTVIYVRASKRLVRPDPAVQLLEDRGPWTADTIPFWPGKREAVVVQRKVSKREADRVAKMQEKVRTKVRSDLLALGHRIKKPKMDDPGRVKRNNKAIPDIGMQALDLEFGGENKRAKPVFRGMIRNAQLGMKRLSKRHAVIVEAMSDPNSKAYKNFPSRGKRIPVSKASSFRGFQNRLR